MARSEPETRTPARYDPFRELALFRGWSPFGSERRLEESFGPLGPAGRFAPAIDISEDEGKYVVTVEIPGASRDDVSLEVEENVLTVRGEKKSEREEKKEKGHWLERTYGSFCRSFTLPADAATDRISAAHQDGVLRIEIPKVEKSKPQQIAIK